MNAFEFDMHFLHGTLALLMCVVLTPMLLTTILSNSFAKQLQRNLVYLILLNIVWNLLAFIEQLPTIYISDEMRQTVYILGVICWIQYGYAIFCVISELAGKTIRPIWKKIKNFLFAWNLIGVVFCLVTGFQGYFYSGIVSKWYGYTAENSMLANVSIFLFLIIPVTLSAIIAYQAIQTNAARIYRSVFSIFVSSEIMGFTLDAILPAFGLYIYAESAAIFLFIITVTLVRANAAISQTEMDLPEILEQLVQQMNDGVVVLNSNEEIEFINDAAAKMFGIGRKAILKKSVAQILPELMPISEMQNIPIEIKSTGVSTSASVSSLYANNIFIGYRIDLADLSKSLKLRRQNSLLEKSFQDSLNSINTRYFKLQEHFRKQSQFLESLLNYLPLRLWSKESVGAYSQQNKKDVAVRGNKISQVENPPFTDLERQAMTASGKIIVHQEVTLDKTGKKHWEKQTFVPMYSENQQVSGVLGLIEDTTEFHALEEERNQLKENLRQASNFDAMSNVAGGLAHDFNNILSGIIGYRDLAESTLPQIPETVRVGKYLEKMKTSLTNATDLVKRTYDQLKARVDGQEKSFTQFKVSVVFDEVRDTLAATLPQNIQIVKNANEDASAYGSPTDFHRIMLNMGKNAILAMRNGGTLTYRSQKCELSEQIVTPYSTIPAGEYQFITVQDTGSGMTPDVVSHIFTPYFTTRAQGQGMGIGLSAAMQLIKRANAYLDLETIIGKGTTFKLYWPLNKNMENPTHG